LLARWLFSSVAVIVAGTTFGAPSTGASVLHQGTTTGPPRVTDLSVKIMGHTANLSAIVEPDGLPTEWHIEYEACRFSECIVHQVLGEGTVGGRMAHKRVHAKLTHITPGPYEWWVRASNSDGEAAATSTFTVP